jgi:serine/threonine protein kinase
MLKGYKHNELMDFWSLGVLFYQMVHGYLPFKKDSSESQEQISRDILNEALEIDKRISPFAQDLLKKLLNKDPSKRLGA